MDDQDLPIEGDAKGVNGPKRWQGINGIHGFVVPKSEAERIRELERLKLLKGIHGFIPKCKYEPSHRPPSEPPMFDYDSFIEENVPSDVRLRKLFPDDIGKRTDYGDLVTEAAILEEYMSWAETQADSCLEETTKMFYWRLRHDILGESCDVREELRPFDKVEVENPLGWWEFRVLDQDGGTKKLEAFLAAGEDIFDWNR